MNVCMFLIYSDVLFSVALYMFLLTSVAIWLFTNIKERDNVNKMLIRVTTVKHILLGGQVRLL